MKKLKKNSSNGLINKITSQYLSCTIPDGSAFAAYQVRSIPTEVFIDSHGKIGHVQLGAISNEDAKKIIKELQ